MSKEKLERRKRMGDDPTAMSKSNTSEAGRIDPQPLPDMPQGKGNMMNNPQVGQSMGDGMPQSGSMSGMNLFPYGDGGLPVTDGRMGAIGFDGNSGMPQNLVAGRLMNQQPYNTVQQPGGESQNMMNGMYMYQQNGERAMKAYAAQAQGNNEMLAPSYQLGPMGIMGREAEVLGVQPMPGGMPANMDTRTPGELNLIGMQDAQDAAGMSTKRGGGRNKKSEGK
nr:hypothetical protein 86 [Pelagibacteraceae bacterium]